jgi:hypothetical protein
MRGELVAPEAAWPEAMPQDGVPVDALAPRQAEEAGRVTRERLREHAMAAVARAVRRGALKSLRDGATPCVDCAGPATMYDHRDYRKPLLVVPVCRGCNQRRGYGLTGIDDLREVTKHLYRVQRFTCLRCGASWAPIKHDGVPTRCGNRACRKTTWSRPPGAKKKGAA